MKWVDIIKERYNRDIVDGSKITLPIGAAIKDLISTLSNVKVTHVYNKLGEKVPQVEFGDFHIRFHASSRWATVKHEKNDTRIEYGIPITVAPWSDQQLFLVTIYENGKIEIDLN